MDELVPVILGIILGAIIYASTTGWLRLILSLCAVAIAGLAATVLSGEYMESWIYLLLDLGEAILGLVAGFVAMHWLSRWFPSLGPAAWWPPKR